MVTLSNIAQTPQPPTLVAQVGTSSSSLPIDSAVETVQGLRDGKVYAATIIKRVYANGEVRYYAKGKGDAHPLPPQMKSIEYVRSHVRYHISAGTWSDLPPGNQRAFDRIGSIPNKPPSDLAVETVQGLRGGKVYAAEIIKRIYSTGYARYYAKGNGDSHPLPPQLQSTEDVRTYVRQQISAGTWNDLPLADQHAFDQPFSPSGDKASRYIGVDVDVDADGKADAMQLLFGKADGRFAVKTGRGQVYYVDDYIQRQPARYMAANGSFNKDTLRELLQQLVNNRTITLDKQDRRNNSPKVMQIFSHGILFPNPNAGPSTHEDVRSTTKQVNDGRLRILGAAIEGGSLFYGGLELKAAWHTYKTMTALRTAGTVLSSTQTAALKKSEATLTSYLVGAMAGGASYSLFLKDKHWDEAWSALAAGKPLESLSYGGKAAVTLLNWTLVAGSVSNSVAQTNVKFGKYLMEQTLGAGKLKGLNWGMFINPGAWNEANIVRVMGPARGAQIVQKYGPVLRELQALQASGQPVVTSNGVLRVSDGAIRAAGFDSLESLVKSMSADGFWRVFTYKPVLNSPFVIAGSSDAVATGNSYFQLALSRGASGVGANLALQSLNSFGLNGSLSINWDQALAAMLSGSVRSTGTPGAWAGEFYARIGSYATSSTGAFFASWGLKKILEARGKNEEKFSTNQLRILGNANQALNGIGLLLQAYADAKVEPPKELFDASPSRGLGGEYLERLHKVMSAENEVQMLAQAKALDRWLDEPIGARGLTRRDRLSQVSMPQTLSERLGRYPQMRDLYRTGTMSDLGIAPRFTPSR
jgi:hypothetical protein